MAVDFHSWSTTAASNTTVNTIDIDEAWAAANINNAIRDIMAQLRLYHDMPNVTTGGSANAQTLTTGFSLSAYQQNWLMHFEAGFTNTATATLNVDSIGAKTIIRPDGQALTPGNLVAGGIYAACYETGADSIVLLNPSYGHAVIGVNAQTGTTYTLALADAGKIITMSNASSNTLTVPLNSSVAFVIGSTIVVRQKGAGATTIAAAAGVTLNATDTGSAALDGQFSAATLVKEGTDAWSLFGAHATVA